MVWWRQALRVLIGMAFLAGLAAAHAEAQAGKMYWIDDGSNPNRIQRAHLDGTGVETLVEFVAGEDPGPKFIALDLGAGKMYWTDRNFHHIQRASLDGTGVEDVLTGLGGPEGIAPDVAATIT